jgi:hypothetical protein
MMMTMMGKSKKKKKKKIQRLRLETNPKRCSGASLPFSAGPPNLHLLPWVGLCGIAWPLSAEHSSNQS